MMISKTTPSELTGQSLIEANAKVWHLGLRLWMWRYHSHLRDRPQYPFKDIEYEKHNGYRADVVFFKHIYAIPVWHASLNYVAYWILMCYNGKSLGTVKHLDYILDASETKV
jgi:hypothetical protein